MKSVTNSGFTGAVLDLFRASGSRIWGLEFAVLGLLEVWGSEWFRAQGQTFLHVQRSGCRNLGLGFGNGGFPGG